MRIIKTNLLILTLLTIGLSLAAGQVQAGFFCASEIEVIKNSPEYKYGKYVVNACKFIANKARVLVGVDLIKRIAIVSHAIKTGAIKFDASYREHLAKILIKYPYRAGIIMALMASGVVAISLLSIELARRSSENDCKREQLEQVLERERKRCMTKYYYI